MLPPITIGIPFYNAEKFLLDSIRSVFAQDHEEWELILMDDGSSDRSLDIAKSIDDPRVHVVSDGKNKKLAARLNEINSLASFEFIARMDADDLMAPDRLSSLLGFLLKFPHYDLVSCGVYSVDNELNLLGRRGQSITTFTFEGLLNKSQRFIHAGLVARKSWYQRNKYNEAMIGGEDSELWRRAAKAGDFRAASISKPLYFYREEGNVTRQKLLTAYRMERRYSIPLIDGRIKRARHLVQSWARSAMVVGLDGLGKLDKLLYRRLGEPITEEIDSEYRSVLERILQTEVPSTLPAGLSPNDSDP